MKFLVLALCVCAASADNGFYKPWKQQQVAKAVAQSVVSAPVVQYIETPLFAAKTVAPVVPKPYVAIVPKVYPTAIPKIYTPIVPKTVYTGKDVESGILRSESEIGADGFNYVYETANGIAAQSSGVLKKVDNSEALVIQGSYEYTAPDGTPVKFTYIADENGYQPQSDLLPVAPPVPEAIARSLQYLRAHPSVVDKY